MRRRTLGVQVASRRATVGAMADFSLPRNDEPFDFRRQAATYGCFRRDYSEALYDAIGEHAGTAAGRRALDVGCGTGFVMASLARRGWSAVGIDFSAPMLAQARAAARGPLHLIRGRGEALPVSAGAAALLTCGTSFHWFAPEAALAEFEHALAPGGWAALFWRYPRRDEPSIRLVAALLRAVGAPVPEGIDQVTVHPPEPFSGSRLVPVAPIVLQVTLEFSAAEFHGYVATLEWVRRLAGAEYTTLLARLREALERDHPAGFGERNEEYLYLARKPAA